MMVPNTSLLVDTRETKELLKLEDSVHILRNGCWAKNKCSLETGTKFLRLRDLRVLSCFPVTGQATQFPFHLRVGFYYIFKQNNMK